MILYPKGCAELSKRSLDKPVYTVTAITVALGKQAQPCLVVVECPVAVDTLRRHQMDLHRYGLNLSVEDLLNWGIKATHYDDVFLIAQVVARLGNINVQNKCVASVARILGELRRELRFNYGANIDCRVLEYSEGDMSMELTHVLDDTKIAYRAA